MVTKKRGLLPLETSPATHLLVLVLVDLLAAPLDHISHNASHLSRVLRASHPPKRGECYFTMTPGFKQNSLETIFYKELLAKTMPAVHGNHSIINEGAQ